MEGANDAGRTRPDRLRALQRSFEGREYRVQVAQSPEALDAVLQAGVPGFAVVATALAGAVRTPLAIFVVFDAIGAALWAGVPIGVGWLTSKRSRSGAFRLPFCATWVPSRRRNASCSRWVAL